MFSKISRYRKLLNEVTTDAKGRSLESKYIRLLPEVSGDFFHTVVEVDRLDHLAFKYYKQAKKWWRICDANPEFMSPQSMLGKDIIISTHFPLTFNDSDQPPWADLLKGLSDKLGVEDVNIQENIELLKEEQVHDDEKIVVHVQNFKRFVIVKYNLMNVSTENLADIMTASGFQVGQPTRVGRVGKKIVIPRNIVA